MSPEKEFIHPGNWAEMVRPGVTLRLNSVLDPGESLADYLMANEV